MTIRPYRHSIPAEILALSHERDLLRRRGQYDRADLLKQQLEEAGYVVKDNPHGAHLVALPGVIIDEKNYRTARLVPSLLDETDLCTFSIIILAQNSIDQTRRCVESVLRYTEEIPFEIILVDNASLDGLDIWAETQRHKDARIHTVRTTRKIGVAEALNLGMKCSRGRYILLLDTNVELTGNILAPLATTLANTEVGLTGLRGLHTEDLRHFEESEETEVEAIDVTCMAFKRSLLKQTGLLDEGYRYPQFMDIDFSFAIRDNGVRSVRTTDLPLTCHPEPFSEDEQYDEKQARLTKRNFYRYLEKWGERDDLLLEGDYEDDEDEDYEDDDDE